MEDSIHIYCFILPLYLYVPFPVLHYIISETSNNIEQTYITWNEIEFSNFHFIWFLSSKSEFLYGGSHFLKILMLYGLPSHITMVDSNLQNNLLLNVFVICIPSLKRLEKAKKSSSPSEKVLVMKITNNFLCTNERFLKNKLK